MMGLVTCFQGVRWENLTIGSKCFGTYRSDEGVCCKQRNSDSAIDWTEDVGKCTTNLYNIRGRLSDVVRVLTMARGALAKKPPKKRHTNIVCRFCATATGILKMAKTNMPKNRGYLRPYNSDRGPKTMGPNAKPSTKRLTPSIITTCETPNSLAVGIVAVLNTEDANVTVNVFRERAMVINLPTN